MEIKQGDIFWADLGEPSGSAPGYRHPYVIIQNDVFNASRINTVIGIALTSNIARAGIPGNVLLKKGEANLPKTCVVNISQITTLDKSDCTAKIGRLPASRIGDILEGLRLITEPKELP
jgi:mRNA interferase MazF